MGDPTGLMQRIKAFEKRNLKKNAFLVPYVCRTPQEVAMCGEEREKKGAEVRKNPLKILGVSQWTFHSLINLITRHLLNTYPVCSIESAVRHET